MRIVYALVAFATASPALAIVGGENDDRDPAIVSLQLGGFPYCSGTLIGARTVLTAGHCVVDIGVQIVAAFGADAAAPDTAFDVVETAQHPDFRGEGQDADVALFRLDRASKITPALLAVAPLKDGDVGEPLRHVGFGVADETTGDGRGIKRSVELPITRLTSTLVFSGADGKQTCDGDSGGPGLFADADGAESVVSIVSDGPNCHEDGWDILVTSVRAFIDETLDQFEDPAASDQQGCSCGSTDAPLAVFLAALAHRRRRGSHFSASSRDAS